MLSTRMPVPWVDVQYWDCSVHFGISSTKKPCSRWEFSALRSSVPGMLATQWGCPGQRCSVLGCSVLEGMFDTRCPHPCCYKDAQWGYLVPGGSALGQTPGTQKDVPYIHAHAL